MIRGVEREAEVVKVDVPFALCIFDERDHHCLQCSVDSFDRVRLRVVWRRLSALNRVLLTDLIYDFLTKFSTVVRE